MTLAGKSRFFNFDRTFVEPVPMRRAATALIVTDMQYHDASADQGLNLALRKLDPGSTDYYDERVERLVIPTIKALLDYFRANSMQVIYLTVGSTYRDYRDVPGPLRQLFRRIELLSGVPDLLWAGNPAFAIRDEIKPLPEETVVSKTTYSAFCSSNLEQILHHSGVQTLVFTGVATNACVESTARDAVDRGFACVIVDEGTADYDPEAQDATLRGFYFNFGCVAKSAREVIAAIEEG